MPVLKWRPDDQSDWQIVGSVSGSGVSSFNGRINDVMPSFDDYTAEMVGAAAKDLSNVSNENLIAKLEESGFSGGVEMDLLWENRSPTSSFPAQTAEIADSSQYAVLIVELSCAAEKGNTRASCVLTDVGSAVTVTTFNLEAKIRSATRVSSGVTFSNAFYYPQGVEAQNNLRLIPQRIYGIKGKLYQI